MRRGHPCDRALSCGRRRLCPEPPWHHRSQRLRQLGRIVAGPLTFQPTARCGAARALTCTCLWHPLGQGSFSFRSRPRLGFVVLVGVKVERPAGRTTLTPTRTTSSCPGGNGTMPQVRSWPFSLLLLDTCSPWWVCAGDPDLSGCSDPSFVIRRRDGRWGVSRGVRPRHSYEAGHRVGVEQCNIGSWPHAIHRRRGDLSITHGNRDRSDLGEGGVTQGAESVVAAAGQLARH